jgi:tetratricopeptide (TPR) repeat protein
MNKNWMSMALIATITGSCLAASEAWAADPCMTLTENAEWNTLVDQMNQEAKDGQYDQALNTIKKLDEICPNVPSVHYTAGMLYRKKNDNHNAFHHFTIATQNTKQFTVDEDLMKRMWFALYETQHPEVIDFLNGDTDSAYQKLIQSKDKTIQQYQLKSDEDDKYTKIMMWTGAGIGITGVVLSVLGGTMMGIYKEPPTYEITMSQTTFSANYDKNNHFYAGTIVLGVGISAAVAGAIIAGIAGYRYVRMKPASDDFDISFSMSLNEALLQIKF